MLYIRSIFKERQKRVNNPSLIGDKISESNEIHDALENGGLPKCGRLREMMGTRKKIKE